MNRHLAIIFCFGTLSAVALIGLRADESIRRHSEAPQTVVSIDDLLTQRRDALAEALQSRLAVYKAGRITADRTIEINDQILDVELELSDTDGAKMKAYTTHLRMARDIERVAIAQLNNGTGTSYHALEAKAQRLLAEINLAQMKSSSDR